MPKSTKATVAQRVDEIALLLIAGVRFADIVRLASTRGWGVSERQLRRYLEIAHDRLAELANRKLGHLLGLQIAQRQTLFARALKAGDLRMCLDILKDDAKLLGLYQKPNAAPVVLSEQSPATDLEMRRFTPEERQELRCLTPEERQEICARLERRQIDELRKVRQDLLSCPACLDKVRAKFEPFVV